MENLNKEDLAELIGLFLGDGCLQKNYLCMWGNIHEEKEHYDKNIVPLFENFFKIKLNAHEKRSNSVYGFYICDKKTLKFWKDTLKFKDGNKTYTIGIPNFILKTKSKPVLRRLVRGVFDCDGCLTFQRKNCKGYSSFKKKFHFYPRICITSASIKLVKEISNVLNFLEIHHTTYKRKKDYKSSGLTNDIIIRGNKNIENFLNQIKPKNFIHLTKYQIWKKYGFCPSNTTLEERRKILKGDIDILNYYKAS